jgi:hypothetical protein
MMLMTETVAPVAKPDSRLRSRRSATVSASALAQHLDCTRAYVGKPEAEDVIQRQGDGFPLDASRTRYIRFLRTERARSPKHEADAELARAKAETLQLKLAREKKQIVTKTDYDAIIDEFAGVVLTALSGLPARCAPRGDLAIRRSIERVVFEVRAEIAKGWPTSAASRRWMTTHERPRRDHRHRA